MDEQTLNKILTYMGFAARANKIAFGKDMIREYLTDKRIAKKVLIVAKDAGERVKKDLKIRCEINNVPYIEIGDKKALAKAVGKSNLSAVGILDENLAEAIIKIAVSK
ncbi:Ribosomal protein L7Ae [Fervidobacterium changbaicum]|uniref:Ribosomal L7Ae/L30e/S12e/Gadd45 family protein n=2 Tax=Fervidobacterium TaxID=2422 RepID=A0AAI8CLH4_FERIS|nr:MULTISPECIES: ribosomal L7Ae/L30e/S12e/Gadd45 family protein [Fervidobacterium]AMW32594.1 ribosomal L7Ae/L30e/S12e/Gadd45 family protein [Fervidobacterium islandicum]QAV32553.1 50S ribosomal protein L7ae family protein [Fervidobacterium changbaicum]SDH85321.1 Ribosomal protein L7Ae [Fervidobacterium changbaicum]